MLRRPTIPRRCMSTSSPSSNHWSRQPINHSINHSSIKDPGCRAVQIHYRDVRDTVQVRMVTPVELTYGHHKNGFGDSCYQPETQWHLRCFDHEEEELTHYAMKDILKWDLPDPYAHIDVHKKYGSNY